jgi:hypothetical protein
MAAAAKQRPEPQSDHLDFPQRNFSESYLQPEPLHSVRERGSIVGEPLDFLK